MSLLNITISLFALSGTFVAGWYMARDKNRAELFKEKLYLYRKVSSMTVDIIRLKMSDKRRQEFECKVMDLTEMLIKEKIIISKKS